MIKLTLLIFISTRDIVTGVGVLCSEGHVVMQLPVHSVLDFGFAFLPKLHLASMHVLTEKLRSINNLFSSLVLHTGVLMKD